MGGANFFVGLGARVTDALVVNWFVSLVSALGSLLYLAYTKRLSKILRDFHSNTGSILTMCFLDNAAWIAFALSMIFAPIAIAVAISESYIIIAVLLGVFVNKEYLRAHQKIGLIIAITSAITLAATTSA